MTLSDYHARTRTRGVNRPLRWVLRGLVELIAIVYLGVRREGQSNIPASGPAIIASNHRSFLDPFIVGICTKRTVYFIAKGELFRNRFVGWLLNSLGAFPVQRGVGDPEMLITARTVLERGDLLVMFPEGTRIRSKGLHRPRRGVGRLLLENRVPVIPAAVVGADSVRSGWLIRPKSVRVKVGKPMTFDHISDLTPGVAGEVTQEIWREIRTLFESLDGGPSPKLDQWKPRVVDAPKPDNAAGQEDSLAA